MAIWQIENAQWDDGDTFRPGEDGFSTEKVKAHAKGKPFNYVGTPNWEAPEPPE